HALRHSYLTLGSRAGIDLRTLQELAGHSTPTLTARYSHRRLHDLAGAVEKLPRILPAEGDCAEPLRATGTHAAAPTNTDNEEVKLPTAYAALTQLPDSGGDCLRLIEAQAGGDAENATGRNPLTVLRDAADCDLLRLPDARAGDRIRTGDVQLGKREGRPRRA